LATMDWREELWVSASRWLWSRAAAHTKQYQDPSVKKCRICSYFTVLAS
jgi:hypothetical protein